MAIPECDPVQLGFSCFILLSTGHLQACWTSASARSIRKLAVQRRASQLYLPLGFWGQGSNSCFTFTLSFPSLMCIDAIVYYCIYYIAMLSLVYSGVFWCYMPSTLFFRNTNRFPKKNGIVIHLNQLAKEFIFIQIRTCLGSRVWFLKIRRSVGCPPEMQRSLREAVFLDVLKNMKHHLKPVFAARCESISKD